MHFPDKYFCNRNTRINRYFTAEYARIFFCNPENGYILLLFGSYDPYNKGYRIDLLNGNSNGS